MRVLVIDDNSEITDMLSRYLKLENIGVTVSNDGRNGLVLVRNSNFDRIILDLAMPEFSGMEVLETICNERIVEPNKIILFTASSISQEETDRMLALGTKACLKKPAKMNELLQVLR
ncbi:response regulator [Nitrosopumilus sp.]|uniref:response regulator n=1 Tax=Nitrosopumilus sp. TaxID=2024843 RepID=UPI002632F235|nr:response regulator [Nitrosopumilus sp.]